MKKQNNRALGTQYEQLAGKFLESKGYRILEYNYRCKTGEIDVIAQDGRYIVFCEVKYRKDTSKGMPSEAVDFRKQKVLSKCALFYVTTHGYSQYPCRFDVIGILGNPDSRFEEDRNIQIQLYQNAFDYLGY